MMKRIYTLLLLTGSLFNAGAQTVLFEDFESCVTLPPQGWEIIEDKQVGTQYHWELIEGSNGAIAGKKSAYCNSGSFIHSEPAKEEWLITPGLELRNESYKLEFKFKGAWSSASKNEYDLQIRVSTDEGETWKQIWSFLNKEQVQKSGLEYPWAAWTIHQPIVDLSEFKGQNIKIAFIHKKLIPGLGKGNAAWVDDILVEKYDPITTPVIDGMKSYKFENIYIGADKYSEVLTLTNIGTDTLRINSISGLDGSDFSSTIDISKVKLGHKNIYSYQILYKPTLTGAKTATMKIQTNGGDLDVVLEGTKKVLPSNYTYEGFENEYFPPLGWSKTGSWTRYNYGLSGNHSAAVSLSSISELTSPRLDLSTGNHKITFDMLEYYEATTDESYGPENYIKVYFSKDGGISWSELFSNTELNSILRKEFDLGSPASDNCYVKWSYDLSGFDLSGGFDNLPEYSDWYIDDIILPPMYGYKEKPVAVTEPAPANDAKNVFNQDLTLSWRGTLFAKGYKLFLGKSENDFSILNGIDLGMETSYTIKQLDHNQKYYWKVVPYNTQGETTNVAVWCFTIMPDQSIRTFPAFEGFEGESFPTLGWGIYQNGLTKWSRSNFNPFDGNHSALSSGNQNGTQSILQTPDIVLPSDQTMQVSFYWGNSVPAGLTKMPRMLKTPAIANSDTLYFEIKHDGEWHTLASITDSDKTNQKWQRERILLNEYIGKTVNLRWRYSIFNGMKSTGAALDNILIETTADGSKPVINKNEWNAGYVNYMKTLNSKEIFTLLNDGERDFTIAEVGFKTDNFITTLAPGMRLNSRQQIPFSITFSSGKTCATVNDEMYIKCDDGITITLPVSGVALDANNRYYGFEEDQFGSTSPIGFTAIDVDGAATCRPVMINYPNYGSSYAYIVINQKPQPEGADWRNIYPVSGDQVLACMSAQNPGVSVEDWIISEKMTARQDARFRFFAKSYAKDFKLHSVTVLVSTTDNSKSSFKPLDHFTNVELPAKGNQEFTEFTVDLSQFSGQPIYVALKHTVSYDGFVAFFDDFFYENFEFETASEHAPQFITEAEPIGYVGVPYTYNFAAIDADGDKLTYNVVGLPEWLSHMPNPTGGIISGTPAKEGTHMFRITASDGKHSQNQDIILTIKNNTALSETTSTTSYVYLDKASDILYVKNMDAISIGIYAPDGRLITQVNNSDSLDASILNDGVYIVRITAGNGSTIQQIIKK
ncbi:MAG: choice-of-anchor J domain-containing protein [Bacteroidales bacterium]